VARLLTNLLSKYTPLCLVSIVWRLLKSFDPYWC